MLIKDSNENQIVTDEFMKALKIDSCDIKTQLEKLKTLPAKQLVDVAHEMAKVTF